MAIAVGDTLRLTAIVSRYDNALRLLPRSSADLVPLTGEDTTQTDVGGLVTVDQPPQGRLLGMILVALTIAAILARALYVYYQKTLLRKPYGKREQRNLVHNPHEPHRATL